MKTNLNLAHGVAGRTVCNFSLSDPGRVSVSIKEKATFDIVSMRLCRKFETQKHHSVSHNLGRNQFPASDYPVSKKRSGRDESSTRNKRPNAAAQSFYALSDAVYRAGDELLFPVALCQFEFAQFSSYLEDSDLAGSETSKSK